MNNVILNAITESNKKIVKKGKGEEKRERLIN
jgi:hypothetical protein